MLNKPQCSEFWDVRIIKKKEEGKKRQGQWERDKMSDMHI